MKWSEIDILILREHYADSLTADIATAIGRPVHQVHAKANKLGLRKSEAWLNTAGGRLDGQRGASCRFQKGHVPWTAGTHYTAGGRSAETRYKPGNLSGKAALLVLPVGATRVNADGYLDVKVCDTPGPQTLRWKAVHRLVWEAAHGPVPAGHVVVFRQGRRTAVRELITVDVLELVTRRELMARNTVHNLPEPLVKLVQLRGALTRQINRRSRQA